MTKKTKLLNKDIRKQVHKDKQQHILEELEEVDRDGYKWDGLKKLRKQYTPNYTRYKDKHGKYITEKQYAEHAADYLEHEKWKKHETTERRTDLFEDATQYKIKDTEITLDELNEVIRLLKCNKAPGPDTITAELIKWCDEEVRQHILKCYNAMYMSNHYYDSLNKASIASIYKNGNPMKLENYCPIALLQTFYKIYASVLKNRLVAGIDPWIYKTQYGFRQNKSTSHAMFIARRLLDIAERGGTNITLVLLDWEKAFDKINQDKLLEVLQRMNTPPNALNAIRQIYNKAQFRVCSRAGKSEYREQKSGIRQGCPLSPYLFTIVMTAMMKDIKQRLSTPKQLEPIQGIEYAEIMFADDTLLLGTHTGTLDKLLAEIEK
jgi:hypothetical protein